MQIFWFASLAVDLHLSRKAAKSFSRNLLLAVIGENVIQFHKAFILKAFFNARHVTFSRKFGNLSLPDPTMRLPVSYLSELR